MKPALLPPDIDQAIVDLAASGRAFASAVILQDTGSAPRKAGTRAILDAEGSIDGTIGGGLVEAEVQRLAVEAIAAGQPRILDLALEGERVEGDRPICGGRLRILVDPTAAANAHVHAQVLRARRRRHRGVLLTELRQGPGLQVSMRWCPAGASPEGLSPAGREALEAARATQAPQRIARDLPEGVRLEVLAEPVIPPPLLLIAGGGHIGQALALQARIVGFGVAILDDRAEFLTTHLYPPGVSTHHGDPARVLSQWPVADDTYIVIVTRGHQHDRQALAACIGKPAAYVGMIGSRRKVAMIRKDMVGSGAAGEEDFDRVYAPIGLDIGAQTVPEIAASIVAQLISVRRSGRAGRMPSAWS